LSGTGGCLCGAVRYTVSGPLRQILVCHCVECRRWCGRAWPATAARNGDLEVETGGELVWLPSRRSEHGAERGFCARCGSVLFWRVPAGERTSIAAGSLDDPSGLDVAAHIWVDHALPWDAPPEEAQVHRRGYPPDGPSLAWG